MASVVSRSSGMVMTVSTCICLRITEERPADCGNFNGDSEDDFVTPAGTPCNIRDRLW